MRKVLGGMLLSLLVLAACGSDDDTARTGDSPTTTEAAEADAFPVSVNADNGPVAIEARPERIVSLSPVMTEMLFAIAAGDQVVAVDVLSNFPTDAPVTDLSGFEPNVEAVATYDPDLVVLTDDIGDVVAGLDALDIPTIHLGASATIDDSYRQIEVLGAATGHVGDAARLVDQMQADIDSLVASLPQRSAPLTYYHELDQTLFSVTSSTFIGEIYSLAGLENIADPADSEGSGYPQLSAEYIIDADPDLIFLADTKCCGQDAATVAARPGWSELTAVQTGGVHPLDDDVASRWGPRVVDFFRAVVEATTAVPAA